MELLIQVADTSIDEITSAIGNVDYEIVRKKSSDGDMSTVVILVGLGALTLKQVVHIVIAAINANIKKSVKVKGIELVGYTEAEVTRILGKLLPEKKR
jgi:hypothetical protein